MIGMASAWVLRPFGGAADHALVEALWSAALAPRWPLLPRAINMVRDGFFAVDRGHPVGCVAVDLAGSIPLVIVAPAHQRRGIGTDLLSTALARLSASGATVAHAGSGGTDYIWPGVPLDLSAAGCFFDARGWHADHDTLDLVADLRDYRPPAAAAERVRRAGVTIAPAVAADLAAVLAFETATFPSWTRWFRASNRDILLARDGAGTIVATLLFDGPGADTVFLPMLGPAAATIGCVGVGPHMEGRGIGTALVARASEILRDRGAGACHIGWTVREAFYTRAGYRPWRRYRMFRKATSCHQAPPSTCPE
jgi:ribosomal protein S18 acetylase RimI-like enzyme